MLNRIGIENFRVFKDNTEFELGPINILTGPNNSGKSSLIKLLSLLRHSFTKDDSINKLNFDGGNHNLGTFYLGLIEFVSIGEIFTVFNFK